MVIGPSPEKIKLPRDYAFTPGIGAELTEGKDALLFGYGPVMLHEALLAANYLDNRITSYNVCYTKLLRSLSFYEIFSNFL